MFWTLRFWYICDWSQQTGVKCPKNITFLKHLISWTSRFWNPFSASLFWNMFYTSPCWSISCFKCYISGTFHFLNVTFLKHFIIQMSHCLDNQHPFCCALSHFMFWMSRFWAISCFEHQHFIFWTLHFCGISRSECHISETLLIF